MTASSPTAFFLSYSALLAPSKHYFAFAQIALSSMSLAMKKASQSTPNRTNAKWISATLLFSFVVAGTAFHVPSTGVVTTRRRTVLTAEGESQKEESSSLFATEGSSLNASGFSTALFSEQSVDSTTPASFGDVVRPKYLSTPKTNDNTIASVDEVEVAAKLKRRNLVVAIVSVAVAFLNYFWQFTHPISPVQLLVGMQDNSAPLSVIGQNGKPTVVDFWAPWCENCKLMAPTLLQVEEEYKDKVNFVLVNGDKREAWPLIETFGVDAIPHMALVTSDGHVETALIGPIPKKILEADLDVLISNAKRQPDTNPQPIPYYMLDVFVGNPNGRKVHFDP